MNALDNPIWSSLTTRHAPFAEGAGPARRFLPAIGPLAGLETPARESLDALAEVTAPGEGAALFLPEKLDPGPKWTVARDEGLLQMVHDGRPFAAPARELVVLGAADNAEMVALAALTKPGPFGERTRELGTFLGVRERGRLAAMTGERLKLPGYTELSAVCTHPDFLGRGYARALMSAVAARVVSRGETPMLHVLPGNARAIAVYESLGFRRRALFALMGLRRHEKATRR